TGLRVGNSASCRPEVAIPVGPRLFAKGARGAQTAPAYDPAAIDQEPPSLLRAPDKAQCMRKQVPGSPARADLSQARNVSDRTRGEIRHLIRGKLTAQCLLRGEVSQLNHRGGPCHSNLPIAVASLLRDRV